MATAETFWKARYDDAIRQAYCERTYGAAHPRPHMPALDMIDLCCSVSAIQNDAAYLKRMCDDAEDRGEERRPTLRAHLHDLRHMQAELAALVTEAESA